MELRHYLTLIWKWLWLVILATAIAATASYLWNSRLPKIYEASTTLLIGQSLENPNPNSTDIFTSQQLALTYIQIAKTEPVLQGVISALDLQMSSDQLDNNVNASIIQGTQLMELRVVDTDPRRAQAIANELANQLISQGPTVKDPEEVARRDFVQSQVKDIQQKIEDSQKRINDLQASISATSSASEISSKQQQIQALQSQIDQWRVTYATLLNTLAPRASNYLSVADPAKLPTVPIAPNVGTSVLLAALIGAGLAVAGALLIEYFDDTLKTPDAVFQALGLSCLGTIAYMWGKNPNDRLITAKHPRASHSEAYRSIRTNIEIANLDKPARTLLITSSNPSEGKSVTAANLAVVMAMGGQRVALVDADLRRPQMHHIFHISNEYGLANILVHPEAALDGFIQPASVDNLQLIAAGPPPPNPAELLGSKRMKELIERLKERFDVIIFDTAPCLPRTDPVILARFVDGVILVVDASYTRRESAIRAKQIMAQATDHILGVILNRISHTDTYYYYYFYSDEKRAWGRFSHSRVGRVVRLLARRLAG